jgi:hypothetical protein
VTRKSGTVELFVDNQSVGSAPMAGSVKIKQTSKIGQSVHNTDQVFDGVIHFLRLYDRALSEAEINWLYHKRTSTGIVV